jgi:hypothetical protein
MKIKENEIVMLILHSPREKLLGVLHEINASGVFVKSIDLDYFDDWSRAIAVAEPHLPMNSAFYPMWRVERITLDQSSGEVPSMSEQFEARTGMRLVDL